MSESSQTDKDWFWKTYGTTSFDLRYMFGYETSCELIFREDGSLYALSLVQANEAYDDQSSDGDDVSCVHLPVPTRFHAVSWLHMLQCVPEACLDE